MTAPIPYLANLPRFTEPALCAETDPELHFPEAGRSTAEAKSNCSRCLARLECLQYAMDNDERWGVWGGTSELDRRVLRRRRAA